MAETQIEVIARLTAARDDYKRVMHAANESHENYIRRSNVMAAERDKIAKERDELRAKLEKMQTNVMGLPVPTDGYHWARVSGSDAMDLESCGINIVTMRFAEHPDDGAE